jgi:hypothetical protein
MHMNRAYSLIPHRYGAHFSGGDVDFSQVGDWSVPPSFPWTGTLPPGVKLPRKGDQAKA